MSADSNPDRAAFQEFLASAYAVQESKMDSQFLSALVGIQRLVASGELGIDATMTMMADSAREVAGAAGVSIGLLEEDQLVYRAGSGCCASQIGTRVGVSLTAAAKSELRPEILRVEDAHTDRRIEGAICRQFGAEALLILPIYRNRLLAGVMEIQFSELHAFQDSELRVYRLLTGLVEEAIRPDGHAEQIQAAILPTGSEDFADGSDVARRVDPQPVDVRTVDNRPILLFLFSSVRESGIYLRCEAGMAAIKSIKKSPAFRQARLLPELLVRRATQVIPGKKGIYLRSEAALAAIKSIKSPPAFRRAGLLPEVLVRRAAEVIAKRPIHSLALSAVIIGLGLTLWITHGSGGRAETAKSLPATPAAVGSFHPDGKAVEGASKVGSASAPAMSTAGHETKPAALKARRMQVHNSEVDYIGDDVTVRHFSPKPAPRKTSGRVGYIGKDVTVRYFTPKPAVQSESR